MNTPHPHTFEIEIDRKEFARIAAKSFRSTAFLFILPLSTLITALVMAEPLNQSETLSEILGTFLVLVTAVCTLAAGLIYCLHISIGKRLAKRRAKGFHAIIDGEFLTIIDGPQNRKTHFRHIHDYTVAFENHKKRPNMGSVLMNAFIVNGNTLRAPLRIPAVPNALEIRDLLAEVDAERE